MGKEQEDNQRSEEFKTSGKKMSAKSLYDATSKVLSHLFLSILQNHQISDSGRHDAINITKFSNVEAVSLDPIICFF